MHNTDIIVIGGGIAGASVASQLCADADVVLLEREGQPGYHSTGRSAAAYIPSYGHDNAALRILTRCSYGLLSDPPSSFQCPNLLHRRGLLTLSVPGEGGAAQEIISGLEAVVPNLTRVDAAGIRELVPLLREPYTRRGWLEPDVFDIDVDALHQGYLRNLRARGGQLVCDAGASAIRRIGGVWEVDTAAGTFAAPLIVNAAGAWADRVAGLAGLASIGLQPLRRTAILLSPPPECDVSAWPLVMCADGRFYFKPDAGQILVSPADEHPSPPCDAQAEELDIAYAVHFAEEALELEVRQVKHRWAGLRNFVADRTPVIGPDPGTEGFFWLAAQGGHGIQIGPAAARLAAGLVLGRGVPEDLAAAGFDPAWVLPERLNPERSE